LKIFEVRIKEAKTRRNKENKGKKNISLSKSKEEK
jgi:hypothetical protein